MPDTVGENLQRLWMIFSSNRSEIVFDWQRESILLLFRAGLKGLPLLESVMLVPETGPPGICPGHQRVSMHLKWAWVSQPLEAAVKFAQKFILQLLLFG